MLKANDLINKSNKIINEAKKVFLEQDDKVNMSKLKNEIQAAVNKYFKDDKDVLEHIYVDTKKDKFGRDVLEVRAELGYIGMVKLADYLNKIVTKYDKYAYFEQETSGIMIAVFKPSQKNEAMLDTSYDKAIIDIKRGCATLLSDLRKLRDFEKFNYQKDAHKAIIARLERFAHLMALLSDYDAIDFEEDGIADTPRTREFYKKLKAIAESLQKNEEVTKSNYKNIINELEGIFKKFAGNGLELGHKVKPNSFDLPFDTSLSVALKDKTKLEPVKAALKKVIDKYGAKKVAHDNDFAYNFGKSNRDGIYVGWNWNANNAFVGYAVNPDFDAKALSESLQKNEDKEFTIKLVTPFGKAKVCSWKAASVNDAVKEFLDANPAYRENKKGTVIAESL